MTLKRLNIVLLLLGLLCLVWMLHAIGVGEVWRTLAALGWRLLPLIALEGIGDAFHTRAWKQCLSGPIRSTSLARLFWMRLAGYAINYFTPTAALGGEVTRASLIAAPGRGPEAASAVLIDKGCMAAAHLLLVIAGAAFLLVHVALPLALQLAMLASASLMTVAIVTFLWLQKTGRLGALIRWIAERRGIKGAWSDRLRKLAASTAAMDAAFQVFYRERGKDLAAALGWHIAGFSAGLAQTAWFLAQLDGRPAVSAILTVWVIGLWLDLLVFIVPMSLGTLEASRVVALGAVGQQAVAGITYGMALRLGQWFWAVLGLGSYAILAAKLPRASAQKTSGVE